MQTRNCFAAFAAVALAGFALNADAALTPIVIYDAADGIGVDSSGMGNNGAATGVGVTTVGGGPMGGDVSFAFDASSDLITTNATGLLNNADIVAAGGFTMEVWINTDGVGLGTSASVIDYAGTERIQFDDTGALTFRISDGGAVAISSVNVTDSQWHHVVAEFTVTNGSLLSAVVGDLSITVDGTTDTVIGGTLTDFGDSLGRPIGIGGHPIGFDGDIYQGLINDPTVSLGVPEPGSLALIGLGGLALLRRRRA